MHCYSMHASAVVSKPTDFAGFLATVKLIDDFFLTVARLPQESQVQAQRSTGEVSPGRD